MTQCQDAERAGQWQAAQAAGPQEMRRVQQVFVRRGGGDGASPHLNGGTMGMVKACHARPGNCGQSAVVSRRPWWCTAGET